MAIRKTQPQATVIKRILTRCSSLGRRNSVYDNEPQLPLDVPRGHFVVYVGDKRSRHVVPLAFLSHPEFQGLLERAEEEFGFDQDMGLTIPCDERVFQSISSMLRR